MHPTLYKMLRRSIGWIEHDGSSACPIELHLSIMIKFKNGETWTHLTIARNADWQNVHEYKVCARYYKEELDNGKTSSVF